MRVAVVNARSANRKLQDVVDQFRYRGADIICISETWEKVDADMEELQELNAITWLSRPRSLSNRGGGVAVVVRNDFASATILNIAVPRPLEIVWVLVTPKKQADVKIIVACFYCSSTKKYRAPPGLLELHVLDVVHEYMAKSEKYRLAICGDINKENLGGIEQLPSFKSDIDVPTRGDSFLEYCVSNLERLQCIAHPLLAPDNPNVKKNLTITLQL